MRWHVAVALRSFVNLAAVIGGVSIALVGLFGALIALGGTGGLTSDPLPDHPRIVAAASCVLIGAALMAGLYWLSRVLVKAVDRGEER